NPAHSASPRAPVMQGGGSNESVWHSQSPPCLPRPCRKTSPNMSYRHIDIEKTPLITSFERGQPGLELRPFTRFGQETDTILNLVDSNGAYIGVSLPILPKESGDSRIGIRLPK